MTKIIKTPEEITNNLLLTIRPLNANSVAVAVGKEIAIAREDVAETIDLGHNYLIHRFNEITIELRSRIEKLEQLVKEGGSRI